MQKLQKSLDEKNALVKKLQDDESRLKVDNSNNEKKIHELSSLLD